MSQGEETRLLAKHSTTALFNTYFDKKITGTAATFLHIAPLMQIFYQIVVTNSQILKSLDIIVLLLQPLQRISVLISQLNNSIVQYIE